MEGQARKAKARKRRSFLSAQKEHGKKQRFGQGGKLTEDTYKYFLRIMEVAYHSKNNEEEMKVLAENVLDEIKGKEIETCCNQLASRVVEELLMYSTNEKLIEISNAFAAEYRMVFTDSFCSHVLQKIIFTLAHRALILKELSTEVVDQCVASFVRTAKYALNNLEDFIFDTYANHILRTIFACVNGYVTKMDVKNMDVKSMKKHDVPDEFEELSKSFVAKIKSWPQFNDLSTQVQTSGCLQAFVYSVHGNIKFSKVLSGKVLEACSGKDLSDSKNEPLAHLVEASLTVAPPKIISKFYKMFSGKLGEFSVLKSANYVVQKLVDNCIVKEQFEEIFDELSGSIPAVLEKQFTGVIVSLAKACGRLKTKQGEFINMMVKGLDCEEPADRQLQLAPLAVCLTKYENYNPEVSKTSLHGAVVVQEMLRFTKPIRLVSSLLSMTGEHLLKLLSDKHGCYITDAFVESTFVGEKSREKLFKKLNNKYAALAISKHGSRSFDAIWNVLNVKQKVLIMEELKAEQSHVVSTMYGRIIASKCMVDLFRQDRNMWMRKFGDKTTKRSNETASRNRKDPVFPPSR